MASKKKVWEGTKAPTCSRSIQRIAEFLSTIVHIQVDAEILHDFRSAESARVLLTVLMDLCLLAQSEWPRNPLHSITGLWEQIGNNNGRDNLVYAGLKVVKEQLERLKYPYIPHFDHRNPEHLLSVPPLPYNVLSRAFKEASPIEGPTLCTTSTSVSWQRVAELAHVAQRLSGRIDILQKQLQQELIRNSKITDRLETQFDGAKLQHTPYELVAASSGVLHSHIADVASMCQEIDTRQNLSEYAPGFFDWVCKAVSGDALIQEPNPHTLVIPHHLMERGGWETSRLQQVLEQEATAARAALGSVQSIIASECAGSGVGGLPAPAIKLPCIPTLDCILRSVQQQSSHGTQPVKIGRRDERSLQSAESLPPGCCAGDESATNSNAYNLAMTVQGITARSRYADLLKIPNFRPCVEDAAVMQKMCLQLARLAARTRARLKKEMHTVVQGTEGLVLLGMGI